MGSCQASTTGGELADNGQTQMPPVSVKKSQQSSNPFFQIDSYGTNGQSVLDNYNFHSKYNDKFVGECSVLEDKKTKNLYLAKEQMFSDEREFQQKYNDINQRKEKLINQNVLQVKEVIGKSTDGFFGDRKKMIVLIDYPFINLHREIANRRSKKIPFTPHEVRNIIVSSIKGYKSIQQAGYPTNKVRLRHIFFGIRSRQTIIKVAQGGLIAQLSNYQMLRSSDINDAIIKDIYLSPQEFNAYKNDVQDYEPSKKQGVFSLGMSLLDVCVMEHSRQVYDFNQVLLDEDQVKSRIEISGKKYGGFVQKLLVEMLKFDVERRPSFMELQNHLVLLRKGSEAKMQLSVIPSQNFGFIQNDASNLQSSSMFKSVVSQPASRTFTSRVKTQKKEEDLESVVEHYTNGNKYIGQKKVGMKHGKGRYQFKDGSYYEGEWENNKISGVGSLFFSNQRLQYRGQWYNDEFNGWGTQYAEDGEPWQKYQGQFQNGVRDGRGKMYFTNGTIYEGQFRSGKISGRGRKICPDGEVEEKNWQTVSPAFFLPDYQ